MIYLNNDRGVSLGLSREVGYQSTKVTQGQKKLFQAFCAVVKNPDTDVIALGFEREKHNAVVGNGGFDISESIGFAWTDTAVVGGVDVFSDGLYVINGKRILGNKFTYMGDA